MKTKIILIIIALFLGLKPVYAETVSLSYYPTTIRQGDPVLVQINNVSKLPLIKKLTCGGKKIGVFMYKKKPSALIGIDLNKKPGNYELIVELSDGTVVKSTLSVTLRDKTETPLGIPEKLGGNTKTSQDKLVTSLVDEKKKLANIRTNSKALWVNEFIPPLKEIFITDPYGNSRKTGEYSIPHKGVDYRAKVGTKVYAVNRGVVRITDSYRDYGKTIFIDHGLGLMSYYLHLSKINVKVGSVVERGQVIGLSGDTGYTLGPHLHMGIRINGITIDPEGFFELFKTKNL